jgi:hypothetical protein
MPSSESGSAGGKKQGKGAIHEKKPADFALANAWVRLFTPSLP